MVLSYRVAIAQKSLSFAKKFFDQMPCLVKFLVVGAWLSAFRTCRDNGRFAHAPKRFQDTGLGIETLIGDHRFSPKRLKQNIGAIQLGSLSSRQMHAGRIARRVHGHVNLGAQPTFAASEGLLAVPLLRALDACW